MLLTIGLYHLTSRARSPAAFLARGSEQTVLGDLTGEQNWRAIPAQSACKCSMTERQSCGSGWAAVYSHHRSVQLQVMEMHGVAPCRVQHIPVLHKARQSGEIHRDHAP